jgi:predicted tellurium resistance membrane protein TerC
MHRTLESAAPEPPHAPAHAGFAAVIVQIGLIDIVFSLDSVFTAVGLANDLAIMVAAIVASIIVMMLVARSVGAFIARHPTIKVLALAFLLLIGLALVAEGVHFEIPKGYLYFAMAFAVGVELINTRVRRGLDERRRGG